MLLLRVEAVDYNAPLSLRIAAAVTCALTGCAVAAAFETVIINTRMVE